MSEKQKPFRRAKSKKKIDLLNSKEMAKEKMLNTGSKVDTRPPSLFPDLYLKFRLLSLQIDRFHDDSHKNIQLLSQINRTKAKVDCWAETAKQLSAERFSKNRLEQLKIVIAENKKMYHRVTYPRSPHTTTKQLLEDWKRTLETMNRMAPFPFLLVDKSSQEEFMNLSSNHKFWMEFRSNDQLLGTMIITLFDKVCPMTCEVFKSLIKGVSSGYGYSGTAVFSIIPDMFCSIGDVTNNNGFGGITLDQNDSNPENFLLKHSIRGILSMKVLSDNKIKGIFNVTFKPMELLDGKNVVFGRVIGGTANLLNYLSRMGTPLGIPRDKPRVSSCGWIDSNFKYRHGAINHFVTL